jgi:organic hydroperoxide reductase OsmC/OhrA
MQRIRDLPLTSPRRYQSVPRLRPLVTKAHEMCPYSKATRGNIDVTLTVA